MPSEKFKKTENLKLKLRLLLVESLVIVIFYMIYALCGNYQLVIILEKKIFTIKIKQGVNNFFKPFNFVCFYYYCFQIKIRAKKNLEAKYNKFKLINP